jgi:hypothetical protein
LNPRRARSARRAQRAIPILSIAAAALALLGAVISLPLGFLILGEDIEGVVPTRWLIIYLAASLGTFVLLLAAAVSGRRARGIRGWRSADDSRFLWKTALSTGAAATFGLATALSDRFPAFLLLASVLAAYVILVRWTWWTWRRSR